MASIKNRDQYSLKLKELDIEKKCGFCNLKDEFILKEYEYWIWVYSEFPYWKYNTIVISKKHKVKFADLLPEELSELKTIFIEAENAFVKSGIMPQESSWGMDILWRQRVAMEGYETRSHIHIHLCPHQEGLFTSILDPEAHLINTNLLKEVL
jgi:diadenosine tetraphosphate (Ap4A) HIT family hydrolase